MKLKSLNVFANLLSSTNDFDLCRKLRVRREIMEYKNEPACCVWMKRSWYMNRLGIYAIEFRRRPVVPCLCCLFIVVLVL